jgi:hypothetical protein
VKGIVIKMTDTENRIKEPDATQNPGCYTCEKSECSCENNNAYMNDLVSCITKEVMDKLGS